MATSDLGDLFARLTAPTPASAAETLRLASEKIAAARASQPVKIRTRVLGDVVYVRAEDVVELLEKLGHGKGNAATTLRARIV